MVREQKSYVPVLFYHLLTFKEGMPQYWRFFVGFVIMCDIECHIPIILAFSKKLDCNI